MKVEFTKMEGLGNDYVFIDINRFPISDPSSLAQKLSDRHTGIGSDGLVLIGGSTLADFSMRIFNSDGSEALMCGNAARCIGKYVRERGLCFKDEITLETRSGVRQIKLHKDGDGLVKKVTVDMGQFTIDPDINIVHGLKGTAVNVGNPHYVVFTDELTDYTVAEYGPQIERNKAFKDKTNVEFAHICSKERIRMKVWERGSGITKACGTGACATAAAAFNSSLVNRTCSVIMDGGELQIEIKDDGRILMTGPAEFCFDGWINIDL